MALCASSSVLPRCGQKNLLFCFWRPHTWACGSIKLHQCSSTAIDIHTSLWQIPKIHQWDRSFSISGIIYEHAIANCGKNMLFGAYQQIPVPVHSHCWPESTCPTHLCPEKMSHGVRVRLTASKRSTREDICLDELVKSCSVLIMMMWTEPYSNPYLQTSAHWSPSYPQGKWSKLVSSLQYPN